MGLSPQHQVPPVLLSLCASTQMDALSGSDHLHHPDGPRTLHFPWSTECEHMEHAHPPLIHLLPYSLESPSSRHLQEAATSPLALDEGSSPGASHTPWLPVSADGRGPIHPGSCAANI